MRFIDEAIIQVSAGNGGDGAVAWRREKYVPRGGPAGGDGGNGGAVIFVADQGLNTLIDFSFEPLVCAGSGGHGGSGCCRGREGEDAVRPVPVGTQVFHESVLVADLSTPGARWLAARGGRGGRGNAAFVSSTKQAPDYAEPGESGESFTLRLVLKSVADVGIIGLPNVGKSTLISSISAARPTVADYPFTTLRPTLGVVIAGDDRFVAADIPGLVPGAHHGKGLGTRFLRHIERTSVLVQLLDVYTPLEKTQGEVLFDEALSDSVLIELALAQFEAIAQELGLFSPELLSLPRVVCFSKGDLPYNGRAFALCKSLFAEKGFDCLLISSKASLGLEEFKSALAGLVRKYKPYE